MESMNDVTARPGRAREMTSETFELTAAVVDLYAAIDSLSLGRVLELAAAVLS